MERINMCFSMKVLKTAPSRTLEVLKICGSNICFPESKILQQLVVWLTRNKGKSKKATRKILSYLFLFLRRLPEMETEAEKKSSMSHFFTWRESTYSKAYDSPTKLFTLPKGIGYIGGIQKMWHTEKKAGESKVDESRTRKKMERGR